MTVTTQHAPGTFCWPELATTDADAARRFYGPLLGWTPSDEPMGEGEVYTVFRLGGRDAAGAYRMRPEMLQQGVPPHWAAYVAVASADQAASRARELGGKVIAEPFDVMEHGRMAVLQDPIGAMFCAWQARSKSGVGVLNEPGSLAWTQLNASDPKQAAPFYTKLFGWSANVMPMPDGSGDYTTFMRGQTPAGGMMPKPAAAQGPSHWLTYFASADVDASAEKAKSLGGKVMVPPTDIPGVGRFTVLQDPQGAYFAMVKFATS